MATIADLEAHAHRSGARWWFSDPRYTHTEAGALAIVEACQLLEMPITDVITSAHWLRLLDTVAQLNERLHRLEMAQGT